MIVRTWRGAVRAADADRYLEYLHRTGLPEYRATPGNLGAMAWRRIEGDRCEYVTVSFWDSLESIRAFAGDDISQAHLYPDDAQFLLEHETTVHHYEVAWADLGDLNRE